MSTGQSINPFDDFLKKVVNLTPSLIAVYNLQTGKYIFINNSLKKILGYQTEEWIKKGVGFVIELVHPDDLPLIMKKNQQALEREIKNKTSISKSPILSFEYRIKHKNGSYRWLKTDGAVFSKDKQGQVENVINISIDITERKLMEEQLKQLTQQLSKTVEEKSLKLSESEIRYKTFMEQSREGIWRIELEKPVKTSSPVSSQIEHFYKYAFLAECNKSMAQMYGFKSPKDLLGARLHDLLIETDPNNLNYLKAFVKSGYRLTDAQSHEKDKQGNDKYFLNSLVGVTKNGFLHHAWGTQRDITERVQIEEKVAESERRLQSIIDGSSQVIAIKNLKGEYISINKQFERDYKISKNDIKGKTDFDIFPIKYAHQLRLNDKEVAFKGKIIEKEETVPKNKDILTYLSVKFPLKNKQGQTYAVCNISTDITERKMLEKQKDEFLSIASHELKTPVTTIKTYAQILKSKLKNQQNLGYISRMLAEANRMTSLVNELLDISRVKTGKLVLHKEKVSFNELILAVIEDMQSITQEHVIEFKKIKEVRLSLDKHRVNQVLINFISNAIKFSPSSKKIIVKTRLTSSKIIVSVKDFGIGISKNNYEKIFQPFFQADNDIDQNYQGLGLGLHISREIIHSHGGDIWVESQEGEGSTFSFSLPLSD